MSTNIEDDTMIDSILNDIDNDVLFISINTLQKLFSDITPIEQVEEQLVAQIDYSNEYKIVYNYFRAILSLISSNTITLDTKNNNSIRILHLTSLCLKLNPANYTVWHLRRQCLNSIYYNNSINNTIGTSTVKETTTTTTTTDILDVSNSKQAPTQDFTFINKEMKLVSLLGGDNPKNYQIWYHRRALLEQLENYIIVTNSNNYNNATDITTTDNNTDCNQHIQYFINDLQYIETVIELDGKNYHAWTHRQWTICSLVRIYQHLYNSNTDTTNINEVWNNELNYCNTVILNDVRNNSGWNQRWFTFHHGSNSNSSNDTISKLLTFNDYTIEADYAFDIASIDPYNESPWRYLIAIIKEQIELVVVPVVTTQQDKQQAKQQQEPYSILLNYLQKIHTIESNFNYDYPRDDTDYRIPNLTSAVIDIVELIDDYSYSTITETTKNSTTEILQQQDDTNNNNNNNVEQNISSFLDEAIELATALRTRYDTIRCNYWKLRIIKLQQRQQQRERKLQQVQHQQQQAQTTTK